MASIFDRLKDLQEKIAIAVAKTGATSSTSPQAIELEAAYENYEAFKKEMARDFRIAMSCAMETEIGMNEMAMAVARQMADVLDFDAVNSMASYCKKQVHELKMMLDDLRTDVEQIRKTQERKQNWEAKKTF